MTAIKNFRDWYVESLKVLFPLRKAGFPILMVSFPLLERYLRQRVGLPGHDALNDAFFDSLVSVVGELKDRKTARIFWTAYRHGLLHEVTLSRETRRGSTLPVAWLSHDVSLFSIDENGDYWLQPVLFAARVLETIESDFGTFEKGSRAINPFPTVVPSTFCTATGCPPSRTVLGTSTEPNDG